MIPTRWRLLRGANEVHTLYDYDLLNHTVKNRQDKNDAFGEPPQLLVKPYLFMMIYVNIE